MSVELQPNEQFGHAAGKVIVLGEHAVVYDVPALALGICLGSRACVRQSTIGGSVIEVRSGSSSLCSAQNDDLKRALNALLVACECHTPVNACVELDLPHGAGLGSSASVGAALARAVLRFGGTDPSDERVVTGAMAWERVFHGNPSGIDVVAAVYGGALRFSRSHGLRHLPLPQAVPLCVGQTGVASSTRVMVEHVAELYRRDSARIAAIFSAIEELVDQGQDAMLCGDWLGLGEAMNRNQQHLEALEVSHEGIGVLCRLARQAGAFGAKLTGAGGGGCVIALAPGREDVVLGAWARAGYAGFSTRASSHATD